MAIKIDAGEIADALLMVSGQCSTLKEEDKRVAETTLPDGKYVSTVRLPFRHSGGIYETMVFPREGDWGDIDSARYETRAEAEAGHAAMVAKWAKAEGR